jgi:hypothetical protein
MNIGIVGARKYQDRQSVLDLVMVLPPDATIITSSCKGVCTWVKEAAEERETRHRGRCWWDPPASHEPPYGLSHQHSGRGCPPGALSFTSSGYHAIDGKNSPRIY